MKKTLVLLVILTFAPLITIQGAEPATSLEFNLLYGFNNYTGHHASDYSTPFYTESAETGWIPGMALKLSSISAAGIYSDFGFSIIKGKTDYKAYSPYFFTYAGTAAAAYTFGRPELEDEAEYQAVHCSARIGYVFERDRIRAIPYIGYAINRQENEMGRISADQEGINFLSYLAYGTGRYTSYKEDRLIYCMPVGLKIDYDCNERLTVGADLAVNFMHKGRLDVSGSGFTVYDEPELHAKPGYRIEIPVNYRITPRWSLGLKPWQNHEACGRSKLYQLIWSGSISGSTVVYEYSAHFKPETSLTQTGLALSLSYNF